MPHLMNCPHSSDGWCLACVAEKQEEIEKLRGAMERSLASVSDRDIGGCGNLEIAFGILREALY